MKFQTVPFLLAIFCFYHGWWIIGLLFLIAGVDDTA